GPSLDCSDSASVRSCGVMARSTIRIWPSWASCPRWSTSARFRPEPRLLRQRLRQVLRGDGALDDQDMAELGVLP
ncbi:hypothetical protein CNY89_29810, partial [Amaricoccus sp. HAR-UPW-R2A-40]